MKRMTGILYHTMSARTSRLAAEIKPPETVRLLMIWAILGVSGGVLLQRALPAAAESIIFTQGLALSAEPCSLWDVCSAALCPMLLLLGGIWLSGCAAFGQASAMLLLLSRGMAFGIAAADCLEGIPLRDGLCITAVLILPYAFCSILLLCYAVRDALRLSNRMTRFLLQGAAEPEVFTAGQDLLSNMLCCLLLTLLAAGVHTVLHWLLHDSLLA